MTNKDKAEIMKLIADAKKELRREIAESSNRNYDDKKNIKNNASISFVTLAEKGDIDEVTSAEHTDLFSEWGIGIDYKQGNIRRYGQDLYKCLQDHTSQKDWTPDESHSLWKKIGDPTDEFPEWSQPVGAGDAYMTGNKVSFEGKHYISNCDNNVWMPTVYGWDEVG